jgi:hypothetical protein
LFRLALKNSPPQPEFSMTSPAGGSQIVFNGTNGIPGWTCYLIVTTNPALPTAQWQVIATNTFDNSGNVCFTNASGTIPWQFYLLKL